MTQQTEICQRCMIYMYDTFQHPLPHTHPLRSRINDSRVRENLHELTVRMKDLLLCTQNHFHFTKTLLNSYRFNAKKYNVTNDDLENDLYRAILTWYLQVSLNKQKHALFKSTVEDLCIWAIEKGFLKLKRKENPIPVLRQWILIYYFAFLEHLSEIHSDHTQKTPPSLESKISEKEIEDWGDLYT